MARWHGEMWDDKAARKAQSLVVPRLLDAREAHAIFPKMQFEPMLVVHRLLDALNLTVQKFPIISPPRGLRIYLESVSP